MTSTLRNSPLLLSRVSYPILVLSESDSDRHKTYSRIDYLLVSTLAISQVHNVDIISNPLCDHSIVYAKITLIDTTVELDGGSTRYFCDYFRTQLNLFLSENAGIKGCIQNASISFSSYLNKTRLGKINEYESLLNTLE